MFRRRSISKNSQAAITVRKELSDISLSSTDDEKYTAVTTKVVVRILNVNYMYIKNLSFAVKSE